MKEIKIMGSSKGWFCRTRAPVLPGDFHRVYLAFFFVACRRRRGLLFNILFFRLSVARLAPLVFRDSKFVCRSSIVRERHTLRVCLRQRESPVTSVFVVEAGLRILLFRISDLLHLLWCSSWSIGRRSTVLFGVLPARLVKRSLKIRRR